MFTVFFLCTLNHSVFDALVFLASPHSLVSFYYVLISRVVLTNSGPAICYSFVKHSKNRQLQANSAFLVCTLFFLQSQRCCPFLCPVLFVQGLFVSRQMVGILLVYCGELRVYSLSSILPFLCPAKYLDRQKCIILDPLFNVGAPNAAQTSMLA